MDTSEKPVKNGVILDAHPANGDAPALVPRPGFESPDNEREIEDENTIRVYPIRYLILFLFCLYSMSNAFQWIEYVIINNVVSYYFGVDSNAITWTSIIYMVTYIPLIFPAAWLMEKKGLRFAVLLGSFGTCLGSWIKCASLSPDRYFVTMIGQGIVAVSQIFILGIPPLLAGIWFSSSEVSRACAVGVFGNQFGIALGCVLPPMIVHNSLDKDAVGRELGILFFSVAGFTTVLFIAIVCAFKDKPAIPPSRARAAAISGIRENYWHSILNLIRNCNYVILLITYGINVGVFYAISTLLNQIVLYYFPGTEEGVGWMGLVIVISGMLGSVVCGFILDKTHKFKETTLAVYILSLCGMVAYTFVLKSGIFWLVFVIASLLGFFMTGYLPIGFEFASEITYPESEGTSSGLLNASAQVFGIMFTLCAEHIFKQYGDLTSNLCLVAMLVIGAIMTGFIKSDLRRQKAAQAPLPDSTVNTLLNNP